MKSRSLAALLFTSFVVNVLLLVALVLVWQPDRPMEVQVVRPPTVTNVFRPIRTNIVVQPRRLVWSDLESSNYDTYIANLRGIGCPEETIRDIIVAEIDELFAARRAREIVTPAQQWWRAEPDPAVAENAARAEAALEAERDALLTRLLGRSWPETGRGSLFGGARPLDGPVLGTLSAETRRRVREIERLIASEQDQAPAAGPDLPPSPVAAATPGAAEKRLRAALAKVLNPEQLEEYLLRYSTTAESLREKTAEFRPSPEEFRALFRAADTYDQQLAALAGDTSEEAEKQRAELLVKREAAMLEALPEERRDLFTLAQTAEYRAALKTIETLELPASKAAPLSQIQQLVLEERSRILNDPDLDEEAQAARLAEVEEQRRQAVEAILGADSFRRYQALQQP